MLALSSSIAARRTVLAVLSLLLVLNLLFMMFPLGLVDNRNLEFAAGWFKRVPTNQQKRGTKRRKCDLLAWPAWPARPPPTTF